MLHLPKSFNKEDPPKYSKEVEQLEGGGHRCWAIPGFDQLFILNITKKCLQQTKLTKSRETWRNGSQPLKDSHRRRWSCPPIAAKIFQLNIFFCQLLRKRHHINKISKRDPVFAGVNIVQVPPMVHWPVSNLFVTTKFVSYFEMTCEQKLSLPCSLHPEEKRHLCLDLYKRLHHKVVALLWVPSQLCWEWSLVRLFIQFSLYPTTSNTQTSSCLYSLTEDVMRYIATRVPHPKTSPYKNVKSVQKAKVCEQSNLQYHVITMRNWQTWNMKGNGGKKRVVIICPQAMLPSSISSIAMATRFLEIFIFVEFLDKMSS